MATVPFDPDRRDAILGTAAVALAAAFWGGSAVIAKSLFRDGLGAVPLSEARSFITFAGIGLIYAARRGSETRHLTAPEPMPNPARRLWPQMIAVGIAIALLNIAYYVAIDRLQVAVAIVIQYTAPALVVIWIAIMLKRMPPPKTIIAVVVATIGVALAAEVTEADLGGLDTLGLLAAGASAIFFACYTLLSERVGRRVGPLQTAFGAFGAASFFWLCFQVPQGFPEALIDGENLLRVIAVGTIGTLLPFILYIWGIHRIAAEKAVIVATLEPPLAALAAWIWLDESLTSLQLLGGALVLIAVAILQTKDRPALTAMPGPG